jgi:hypothetical protein
MKITLKHVKAIKSIVIDLSKEIKDHEELSPQKIFNHKLWIWTPKVNLTNLLVESGINPDCILCTLKGKYKNDIYFLKNIMNEISVVVGYENMNDNSLHNYDYIPLPKSLQTPGEFPLSDKLKLPLKKVKPNSIQVSLCRTFKVSSWKKILTLSGFENVERKKSFYQIDEVLQKFKDFVLKEYKLSWDQFKIDFQNMVRYNETRVNDIILFKLLNRLPDKLNIKISHKNINRFSLGVFIIIFYDTEKTIEGVEEYLKNNILTIEKFSLNGRSIIKRKNNEGDIQEKMLRGYVDGFFGHGDYFGDNTTYRYINHNIEEQTRLYFSRIGLEIDSLRYLKNVINSKYNSKEKIWIKFRELVKKSLDTNQNCLTREYLEQNDPGFIRDCFRLEKIETNSWEKVLKEYGLSPDVWNNTYSMVSHRGFVFQKSVYDIFKSNLIEVNHESDLLENKFIHNKLISKGIKPDFIFNDFIIDCKFSISHNKNKIIGKESIQLDKYIKYFGKPVHVLTFNQNSDSFFLENGVLIKNINFKSDFRNWVKQHFNFEVSDKEMKSIFSRVNNIPFWKNIGN